MKKIALNLRVTPERAVRIVSRLYGSGDIGAEKYHHYMARINAAQLVFETARNARLEKRMAEIRCFYKKEPGAK